MIEMPVLSIENMAGNPGDKKLPAHSMRIGSSSRNDFRRQLQTLNRKSDEDVDDQSTGHNQVKFTPGGKASPGRIAILSDYVNPALVLSQEVGEELRSLENLDQVLITPEVLPVVETGGVFEDHKAGSGPKVADILIEDSARSIQQDTQTMVVGSGPGSGQVVEQPAAQGNLSSATTTAEVSVNMQPAQTEETADIHGDAAVQQEAGKGETSRRFRNIVSTEPTNPTKATGKTGDNKNKLASESTDAKASNDKSDVKKLIDFEANRMQGNKLPTAVKADNQETETDSQAMHDKVQWSEIKMAKTPVHLQDQVRGTINPKEVLEQVVDKVEVIQNKKVSELTLELKPDYLGKMTIKLAVEEGGLTARFVTDNFQVKSLLESNMNSLKQTLESHGIKVEKTEVNVQLNNGGMFDGSEGHQQDRWQNQGYSDQAWNYAEEILSEEEFYYYSEADGSDYADGASNDDGSMNFLV